ncbi:LacI family DNA-binding transcriptional regulator [Psychromonas aquimarina]|uniref:LacI family DNA-binding transcriptional regulator n=1 Tax=Psychromonas aquimarina TaxID=444919 RepID=UPI0003FF81CE|nr:LacI family DNA-binding transcriptional regulator [Psychromonas aquimarina]
METLRKRRGTGRVTLADVAKSAGVGAMTVSRALRTPEQVSEKLRDKIQLVVEELGYIPNQAAGALASGKSDSIALILPSFADKVCSNFIPSFQEILNQAGYQLVIGYSNYSITQEEQLLSTLLANNPAAVVLFGSEHSAQTVKLLKNSQAAILELAEINELCIDLNVGIDHYQSSKEMTRHLIKQGFQKIAFVGARSEQSILRKQLRGWQAAMLENYLAPDHFLTSNDEPNIELGCEGVAKLLLQQPDLDALICSHEEIAMGALFECQRRVLQIPKDIALTCLDGSTFSEKCIPRLTSIEINYAKMAGKAARLLLQRLTGQDQNLLKQIDIGFKLCERASS